MPVAACGQLDQRCQAVQRTANVGVAQPVARRVANAKVAGSIPVIHSSKTHAPLAQLAEASRSGREGSRFESGEGYNEAWLDNRR